MFIENAMILTKEYGQYNTKSNSFTEAVPDILDNGGNMHDYTGIKIYTTIGGDIIRINQYINGKFIDGLYFPALKSDEEIDSGYHSLISFIAFHHPIITHIQKLCQLCGGKDIMRVNFHLKKLTANEKSL